MQEHNVARGIAMMMVLFIHLVSIKAETAGPHVSPAIEAFSFLLPMFFLLAGLTYRGGKKPVMDDIKSKVWGMFVYYAKYFAVIWVLYTIEVLLKGQYDLITCIKAGITEFFMMNRTILADIFPNICIRTTYHDIFVAVWFLWVFMESMLMFIPLERLTRESVKQEVLVLALSCIAALAVYLPNWHLPFFFQIAPSITVIMLGAHLMARLDVYDRVISLNLPLRLAIVFGSFLFGVWMLTGVTVSYLSQGAFHIAWVPALRTYVTAASVPIWFRAMLGIMTAVPPFLYFCRYIGKIPFVGDFLSYFGINSMDTMLLHVFFAVTLCNIFPLTCRRLMTGKPVTDTDMIKSWITFFLTVILCWCWPKVKMAFMKWNAERRVSKTA